MSAKHSRTLDRLHHRKQTSSHHLTTHFPRAAQKLSELNLDLKDLRRHSAKMLSAAILAGSVMTTLPKLHAEINPAGVHRELPLTDEQLTELLKFRLKQLLPQHVGPLTPDVEMEASKVIADTLGITATAELEGNHLNTSYGYMGAEQHLPRYPGDTIDQHDDLQVKGITANRGAFGYFANSKEEMTPEKVMQEKYYVAVQTLYLPNWNTDHPTLKKWYNKRKVLVVNPANGRSVVAVVGDAGPAAWTGKHFGGSPEIMKHLELNRGKQKGAVLLFFIDESEQKVALGPIDAKSGTFIAETK